MKAVPLNSADGEESRGKCGNVPRWVSIFPVLIIGALSAVCAAVAPLAAATAVALTLVLVLGIALLGPAGVAALLPAVAAATLLNRFDEQFGFSVDRFTIRATYWLSAVCLAFLLLTIAVPSSNAALRGRTRLETTYRNVFWTSLAAFVLFAALSSLYNAAFDRYVPGRSLAGEFLALGILAVSAGFAGVLPFTNLSARRTLAGIRVLLALTAATALVISLFAVAPERIALPLDLTRGLDMGGGFVRGWTPLGHANTVAAAILLFLPFAIIPGFRDASAVWRLFHMGCAGTLILGLLFCRSRAGLAVAVPIAAACYVYLFGARGRGRGFGVVSAVLFTVLVGVVVVTLFHTYDFSRFWARDFYGDASIERRMTSMATALRVFRDYPLLGASPNSVYPRDDLDPNWIPAGIDTIGAVVFYRGHETAPHPHNLFLTILAEFGLLGGTAYLVLLGVLGVTFLRLFVRARATARNNAKDCLFAFGLGFLAFLGASLGGALFVYSMRIALVFWIFLGLSLRYGFLMAQEPPATRIESACDRL